MACLLNLSIVFHIVELLSFNKYKVCFFYFQKGFGVVSESTKNKVTYRRTKIRIIVDFSSQTMQARRKWSEILKILKVLKNTIDLESYLQQKFSSVLKEK